MRGKRNGRQQTTAPLPQGTFDTAFSEPEKDPLIGQVVDGRYEVQELIGAGGMGRVYRAKQMRLDRPVALKVLSRGLGADPLLRERFFIEASLTSKLKHPNTVTVFDYGCTEDEELYIAMEFLEGRTLGDLLDASGPVPWWQALAIGQQVGKALREAHQLGVVHRDIKPGNVMLLAGDEELPQVKVLDFGLVKSFVRDRPLGARAMTETGMVMGSPEYVAPEQAEHNRADPRSDVYSLGVVLYEMLCGSPPFRGRYDIDVLLKHVREEVPPLEASAGPIPIPAPVRQLVMRCLEKNPEDRFASMNELLQAIAESGGPTLVTPGHGMENVGARSLSSALPAIFFLLAATLGVAAAGLALWRSESTAPAPAEKTSQTLPVIQAPPVQAPKPPEQMKPQAPAEPRPVGFHVLSEPTGAQVQREGVLLGMTPLEFELPAEEDGAARAELLLTLPGFLPLRVTTVGEGPKVEVLARLEKEPPPHRKPARTRGKQKGPANSGAARLEGEEDPQKPAPPFETEVPALPPPSGMEIRHLEEGR